MQRCSILYLELNFKTSLPLTFTTIHIRCSWTWTIVIATGQVSSTMTIAVTVSFAKATLRVVRTARQIIKCRVTISHGRLLLKYLHEAFIAQARSALQVQVQ